MDETYEEHESNKLSARLEIFIFLIDKFLNKKIENDAKNKENEMNLNKSYNVDLTEIKCIMDHIKEKNILNEDKELKYLLSRAFTEIEWTSGEMEKNYASTTYLRELDQQYFEILQKTILKIKKALEMNQK